MSKKHFALLDIGSQFETKQTKSTRWELCFIFQEEKSEALICPDNSTRNEGPKSYKNIAENLLKFQQIQQRPKSLFTRINGDSLDEDVIENKAKFHKTHKYKYNNYHYERACKRREILETSASYDDSEDLMSYDKRRSRSDYSAKNFSASCFICDKGEENGNLCNVRTLEIDQR